MKSLLLKQMMYAYAKVFLSKINVKIGCSRSSYEKYVLQPEN